MCVQVRVKLSGAHGKGETDCTFRRYQITCSMVSEAIIADILALLSVSLKIILMKWWDYTLWLDYLRFVWFEVIPVTPIYK